MGRRSSRAPTRATPARYTPVPRGWLPPSLPLPRPKGPATCYAKTSQWFQLVEWLHEPRLPTPSPQPPPPPLICPAIHMTRLDICPGDLPLARAGRLGGHMGNTVTACRLDPLARNRTLPPELVGLLALSTTPTSGTPPRAHEVALGPCDPYGRHTRAHLVGSSCRDVLGRVSWMSKGRNAGPPVGSPFASSFTHNGLARSSLSVFTWEVVGAPGATGRDFPRGPGESVQFMQAHATKVTVVTMAEMFFLSQVPLVAAATHNPPASLPQHRAGLPTAAWSVTAPFWVGSGAPAFSQRAGQSRQTIETVVLAHNKRGSLGRTEHPPAASACVVAILGRCGKRRRCLPGRASARSPCAVPHVLIADGDAAPQCPSPCPFAHRPAPPLERPAYPSRCEAPHGRENGCRGDSSAFGRYAELSLPFSLCCSLTPPPSPSFSLLPASTGPHPRASARPRRSAPRRRKVNRRPRPRLPRPRLPRAAA